MIFWQRTFSGFVASGTYRGWNLEIVNKILSRTKFRVIYTLDENSLVDVFKTNPQNYSFIQSKCKNIMQGRTFTEYTEIDTFLRWPRTLNDEAVTHEAATHAVAHLNYALKDAVTYLRAKGITVE